MTEFDGFLTVMDAEKLRALAEIAEEINEEGDSDKIVNIKGILALPINKSKRSNRGRYRDDKWSEGFDENGDELKFDKDSHGSNSKSTNQEDVFSQPDSEYQVVIKVYYIKTDTAFVPYCAYLSETDPSDYRFEEEYVSVVFRVTDFIE